MNVAIGVAGMRPIRSYIGSRDMYGRKLRVSEIAVADEIASAAELVMGKSEGVPAAIVRGYRLKKQRNLPPNYCRDQGSKTFPVTTVTLNITLLRFYSRLLHERFTHKSIDVRGLYAQSQYQDKDGDRAAKDRRHSQSDRGRPESEEDISRWVNRMATSSCR